jgi:hypothetical protein
LTSRFNAKASTIVSGVYLNFLAPMLQTLWMLQPDRGNLQNEGSQLIERVSNLDAHKNERCDHQIETKMH